MHDFSLLYPLINILLVFGVLQGTCAMLIFLERKMAAWVQDRHGPNRVGPFGLFQSLADGLKFVFKEELIPGHVDKRLFILAPCVSLVTAMLAFSVVPFGPTEPPPAMPAELRAPLAPNATAEQKAAAYKVQDEYKARLDEYRSSYQPIIAPNVDIGILFIFAVSSLAVYGIILGGWSANNKYALLGGLRSSAQIISYEIPLGLSILGVVLMTGSLNLEQLIWQQAAPGGGQWPVWNFFYQPLAFIIFMVSAFAETNRLPFDLPEAEQELIGGFHTEYSAMKFAMFFLGEYTHVVTTSFLMIILFFGGWHFPYIASAESFWLLKLLVLVVKVVCVILFIMLIRWTIPRFRFDQLMGLAWKVLIPMAIVNLVAVMFVLQLGLPWWVMTLASVVIVFGAGLVATRDPRPRPLAA